VNAAVNLCKTYSHISMHILWKFHQNLRAGDFKPNFSFETELPVMRLLSEFFFFQCIGIRKLRGLARPLNVIQSSYNFAGFISMPKRNVKYPILCFLNFQSYLRFPIITENFHFLGHTIWRRLFFRVNKHEFVEHKMFYKSVFTLHVMALEFFPSV